MAIANRLYYGLGIEKNCDSAYEYYETVAEPALLSKHVGYRFPKFNTSFIYEDERDSTSISLEENMEDIITYQKYHAETGDATSLYVVAQYYLVKTNPDYEKAREYAEKAAESDIPGGLAILGHLHLHGLGGLEESHALARQYFSKAASKDSELGHYGLGLIYYHGLDNEDPDEHVALNHFQQAAKKDLAEANYYVGKILLEQGNDQVSAKAYFLKALKFNHLGAMFELGRMAKRHFSCKEATEYMKAVAEKNSLVIEVMKTADSAFKQSPEKSLINYLFLADLGISEAQCIAAKMIRSHPQGKKNLELELWLLAAKQAKVEAANIYLENNPEKSAALYKEAYLAGNPKAAFKLGYMYQKGIGVSKV
ncbi:Tetratricopeptide-like helical domain-containing protein [Rozella allomycis CSF55]|uniref:Tetratricopeptide-like helical domain-containing protein n=1 Tax=Rozella allomycis (strain CSF55) TaxID=988480 RepID=A0A075AUE5_ROZAC|nr:Tetratricopeptide-like helical domain-containing protein [Rozella allomycis CSF55]|eukprot:EPZ33785.1 Tetratricopeptide-like helical domain-containing protein [Rozella allomycis CSF55]